MPRSYLEMNLLSKLSGLSARLRRARPARRPIKRAAPDRKASSVDLTGRVGFAVGTGRCGTHFLAKLLEREPEVAAAHEREPLLETFHRYCKWHDLPVDDEGFLQAMESRIRGDLVDHAFSFESSCHLSLSVRELDERFKARFVLLIRHPRDVVKSHIGKGWYESPVVHRRADLAPGYQDFGSFHHFLGRIVPRGDELEEWNRMTRVGKLAWFWTVLNQRVLDQAAELPEARWRMVRLEEFDYAAYRDLAGFLGFSPTLSSRQFDQIRESRPGTRKAVEHTWNEVEWRQFESQVRPLAEKLGYPELRGKK